jgi:hypothetical protein
MLIKILYCTELSEITCCVIPVRHSCTCLLLCAESPVTEEDQNRCNDVDINHRFDIGESRFRDKTNDLDVNQDSGIKQMIWMYQMSRTMFSVSIRNKSLFGSSPLLKLRSLSGISCNYRVNLGCVRFGNEVE